MELRTFSYIDILQPQLTGFFQTVASGFMPLERQAALFVEIAPGIAINRITDVALKATRVIPGMQIVERAYGLLEVHSYDQGEVRQAGEVILQHMGVDESARLKPKILSEQVITGIEGYHSQLINRMRHGDMIAEKQTLYTLEVVPAAYAAICANEAEKAAPVHLMEVITFGAVGRLWLGGNESEIESAQQAIRNCLASITGR
jgi:hypothetical protein